WGVSAPWALGMGEAASNKVIPRSDRDARRKIERDMVTCLSRADPGRVDMRTIRLISQGKRGPSRKGAGTADPSVADTRKPCQATVLESNVSQGDGSCGGSARATRSSRLEREKDVSAARSISPLRREIKKRTEPRLSGS